MASRRFDMLWLLAVSNVFLIVSEVVVVADAPPSVSDEETALDEGNLWLSDEIFYDDLNIYDRPQGDQAVQQQTELCPPVPASLPEGSCHAPSCASDRECENSEARRCCYNGCIYTCLPILLPPAYLDWIREPRRRLRSGLSWLVTGPDLANEEEPCSTSPVESDADPLLCPRGYFCSISDEGDPTKGIPNQGTCVKQTDDESDVSDIEMTPISDYTAEPATVTHNHACDLEGQMLLEGHAISLDGKHCTCRKHRLVCAENEENL